MILKRDFTKLIKLRLSKENPNSIYRVTVTNLYFCLLLVGFYGIVYPTTPA
jgi:hypothetical protein